MRALWRNVPAFGMRVGLSAAAMMGIAYAQVGPAFEVSPAVAGGRGRGAASNLPVSRTPERIEFQAALMPEIMAFAYGFPLDRVERRPQWMYDDRYDVAVTTAAPTSLPEQKLLLQKLLGERFGLVVHRISNPSPVYFLVRGSKVNLTETQEGDSEDIPRVRCNSDRLSQLKPGDRVSSPANLRVCVLGHASMSDLAASLYSQVGLPVLDKTGIAGLFDIELPSMATGGAERTIPAVRSALGLDLELHQGTAESLIIDHAEKPSQN